jgi:hypothetical protein
MTQIAPLDGTPVPTTALPSAAAGPASASPQAAPAQAADQPAVIVSLSAAASSSVAASTSTEAPQSLGELDPNAISDALARAGGANGFADAYEHGDWAKLAAKFGQAIVDFDKASILRAAVDSASLALNDAHSAGIPVQDSVSPEATKNGAAPGTISVSAFTFTNAGSTYTVTHGNNGTLVGTKDGQAWQTWQLTTPYSATSADHGANAALQTLAAVNAKAVPDSKLPSGVDVSV